MLPIYSRVWLLTDRFASEGAKYVDLGHIIETWNEDAYEVEFSDRRGVKVARIVARRHELELCEPPDEDATGTG